ncbi:MAG: cytochrome c oxidase subunit II, partial [Gammaproteobacteria bacterium]
MPVPRCFTGRAVWSGLLVVFSSAAVAQSKFNLTRGVTPTSREVYDLHMLILWICVAIAAVVFAVMFYSIYAHRKSRGAVPAQFHENPILEVLWTVIPALILVAMAVPATRAMINLYDHGDADMTIKVTGHQWKWRYDYLEEGIGFFSNLKTSDDEIQGKVPKSDHYLLDVDNPLVLPVNKKIRFVITSADVLHAWWVPAFGWKQDAIPGFINENWAIIDKPGVYRGQCAE